jgi:hypothetical protein
LRIENGKKKRTVTRISRRRAKQIINKKNMKAKGQEMEEQRTTRRMERIRIVSIFF